MSHSRSRVVIAGGGIAGLDALTALHAVAGSRVDLTLVASEDDSKAEQGENQVK